MGIGESFGNYEFFGVAKLGGCIRESDYLIVLDITMNAAGKK